MSQPNPTTQSIPGDAVLWQRLVSAENDEQFFNAWLALQCARLPGVVRAVLVLAGSDNGPYRPVGYWPEGQGGSPALAQLAERSLSAKQGVAGQLDEAGQRSGAAYPIMLDEHLCGVVAVELGGQVNNAALEVALKQLHWGSAWLQARLRAQQSDQDAILHERLVAALDLIVSSLELPGFQASAKAVVTELAQRLVCDRVSIGFLHRDHIRVEAISHSVDLDKQMNMVRAIGQAMDEAYDQRQPLSFPAAEENIYILRQHESLAQQFGSGTILTIPLYVCDEVVGVLLFERPAEALFSDADMELCRSVAAVVAPILHEKKLNDRSLLSKAADATAKKLKGWVGPEHYLKKTITLLVTLFVITIFVIDGQYRVTADTVLEGKVQRSIVTPFDGFVAVADYRAGDVVAEGQVLAQLEDKDLQLERLKWLSQHGQLSKQYDEAMALRDRAKVNIIGAQMGQADAQLKLVDEKLARTKITAPFNGVIISGDLSQTLGGSVAQGDQLFVIAPLDDYRVILQVNERYIQDIQQGQAAMLVLSSLPEQKFALTVDRITPISTAEEGENYFRVEALLDKKAAQLRPGMEGVAKVEIGERSLAWIWTHDVIAWMRLWLWRWLP